MAHILKVLFSLILVVNSSLFCFSQLTLYPELGIAYSGSIVEKNTKIVSYKAPNYFVGFYLEKRLNCFSKIGLSFDLTIVNLNARSPKTFVILEKKSPLWPWKYEKKEYLHSLLLGFDMTNISVRYTYQPFEDSRTFLYHLNKRVFNLNLLGCLSLKTLLDTAIPYGLFQPGGQYFLYSLPEYGDKIVKNKYGMGLELGSEIQFKRRGKDNFKIGFIHSFGLMTLVETPYIDPLINNDGTTLNINVKNNGSFSAFYISYPIKVLSKKGERYRDRHPKQ